MTNQEAPAILFSGPSIVLVFQLGVTMPSFLHGSLGPCACTASTLELNHPSDHY